MKSKLLLLFMFCYFLSATPAFAASNSLDLKVITERGVVVSTFGNQSQELTVKISSGPDAGKTVKMSYDPMSLSSLRLNPGDQLIISKQNDASGKTVFSVNDRFRIPEVLGVVIAFLFLILLIAGKKGIGSIIGLGISLGIIFVYIVPSILGGTNPLLACMVGAIAILFTTTYIAHGFSRQTTIAMFSTFIALILTWALATIVTQITSLSGFGTEETYDLHLGLKNLVDFQGLLLGGIIIATLGALNDVTTTQAAAIFEIHRTDPKMNFDQLLKKGLSVGREHVVSLINTLVLAFVGTSLALFLIYFFNPTGVSLITILNSEIVSEEIIKTIAGTSGLLLAMPIVSILAAFICVDIIGEKHK